jgi:hypothetical protein
MTKTIINAPFFGMKVGWENGGLQAEKPTEERAAFEKITLYFNLETVRGQEKKSAGPRGRSGRSGIYTLRRRILIACL